MTWQPLPETCKAAEVWLDFVDDPNTKYFLLEGAVRSSKTFGSILAWCDWVENFAPPGPLIMIGNTRETLIQNVIDPLIDLVGPKRAILNRGIGTLTLFGRPIYLFGAPNIAAMRKLQGKGAVGAYCDEAPTYPKDVWQMLGTRSAADGIKIIATMNPDSPMHWMKKEYLDRLKAVNGQSWHFTLDDNPFLSEKVKAELKSQYTGLWKKRYIDGLWVMAEGGVYDLPEEAICTDDLPDCDKFHVAIDYGITNPTHFLLFGRSGQTWYILKEWRWDSTASMKQKTDKELSSDLGKFLEWKGNKVIPETIDIDPSATSFIVQTRQDYPLLDIVHAINPVLEGIRTVSTALASGALKVCRPFCPILLNEYGGYVWDSKAQLLGEDAPLKVNDHAMDPLRYGCMRIFRYS
jgi:PBSX family phage terminase large subunit